MSRIGRAPIAIPTGVEVKIDENNTVAVKGPKGSISRKIHPRIKAQVEGSVIHVTRHDDEKESRSLHGLSRTLIANMVTGVTTGFSKTLEVNGVGYRAAKEGKKLIMNLGYSHQVIVEEKDGIKIDVPTPNTVVVSGIDKELVGQFAADVRKKRMPEPYKGKGIKYANEVIRRKEGKTGAKK
jgi:large subunit ribosomal protein L6